MAERLIEAAEDPEWEKKGRKELEKCNGKTRHGTARTNMLRALRDSSILLPLDSLQCEWLVGIALVTLFATAIRGFFCVQEVLSSGLLA